MWTLKEVKKMHPNVKRVIKNCDWNWDYNCWGFTVFVKEKRKKVEWVEREEMERWLEEKTVEIEVEEVRRGDVVVVRGEWGKLLHTAVMVSENKVVQKCGVGPLNNGSIGFMSKMYPGEVSWRRVRG